MADQINQNKPSWWADFAKGPRRDLEFMAAAKRVTDFTPAGAPIIEEGSLCSICYTDLNVNIRDWRGYSLEAVKTIVGQFDKSIVRDANGWRIFFCVPCAQSWLFPYMEKFVGYTSERILTEVLSMTDKYVPGKVKSPDSDENKQ